MCQEEDGLLSENSTDKKHVADVEALMPQLRRSDYYTQPQIHEMAVKERAYPGFYSHVKNFVVGRHGYGSIKFLGETDVQKLNLDSHVQFNNREVIVYMDESKKPPVGQVLNKPAEVTLLNVKCIDKKTGKQYLNGPKIDRYREILMKKGNRTRCRVCVLWPCGRRVEIQNRALQPIFVLEMAANGASSVCTFCFPV